MERLPNALPAPTVDLLRRFNVNTDQVEVTYQPLYDILDYPAAGQSVFTFFQRTVGSNGVTLESTNMEAGGQLPSPKNMIVTGIEVRLLSGLSIDVTDATDGNIADDVNAVMNRGHLQLFIQSKSYLDMAPLAMFPATTRLTVDAALNSAAPSDALYAQSQGRPFNITPVRLNSNANFRVSVNFPDGVVALPSGDANTRLMAILHGYQFRYAQ